MGIYSQGLALRGIGASAHSPRRNQTYGNVGRSAHSPRRNQTYGNLGRTDHAPGKHQTYGMTFPMRGQWGDFGRSVLSDLFSTGKEWFLSRNPPGSGGSQAPVIIMPAPQSQGFQWPKWTPLAVAAAVLFFLLRKGR